MGAIRTNDYDKVDLTLKSVEETLACDHSNESYRAVFNVVLLIRLHAIGVEYDVLSVEK